MGEELTLERVVRFAVKTEELGRDWYEKLAEKCAGDEEIRATFDRLARDEKAHEQRFRGLLKELPALDEDPDYEEKYGLVRAMAVSEFFASREDLDRIIGAIDSTDDALQKALDFEKATLGYYRSVADLIGESPILEEIIAAEKEHISALLNYLLTDAKFRGLGDDFP